MYLPKVDDDNPVSCFQNGRNCLLIPISFCFTANYVEVGLFFQFSVFLKVSSQNYPENVIQSYSYVESFMGYLTPNLGQQAPFLFFIPESAGFPRISADSAAAAEKTIKELYIQEINFPENLGFRGFSRIPRRGRKKIIRELYLLEINFPENEGFRGISQIPRWGRKK